MVKGLINLIQLILQIHCPIINPLIMFANVYIKLVKES